MKEYVHPIEQVNTDMARARAGEERPREGRSAVDDMKKLTRL